MWITKSNRLKHFIYAIPAAMLGSLILVIGMASGMELKDKLYGNKWDWLDWLATILGGLIGQALQLLILYIIESWSH